MGVCDFTFYVAQVVCEREYRWVHDAMVWHGGMIYVDDSPYVYVMYCYWLMYECDYDGF